MKLQKIIFYTTMNEWYLRKTCSQTFNGRNIIKLESIVPLSMIIAATPVGASSSGIFYIISLRGYKLLMLI